MCKPVLVSATLYCLLVACSGLQTYRSDYEINLFITMETNDPGWLSGVDASLDIYRMQGDCDVHYLGTVHLGDSPVEVGVPADEVAVLVFNFERASFLGNTRSSFSHDFVLSPLAGYVYDVGIAYSDTLYSLDVHEHLPGDTREQLLIVGMRNRNCYNDI